MYISVKGGKPPITINNREKGLLSSWKWGNMRVYQVSSLCVLPLESLRSKEVIWKKNAWGYLLLWSWWKRCNTHAYQVSPPCVLQLATLRSEEVLLMKIAWGFFKQDAVVMETCNRHGNGIIGIRTKFISVRATIGKFEKWRGNFKRKVPEVTCYLQTCFVVILMLAIAYIMYTKFRPHSCYQLWVTLTHVVRPL